MDNILLPQSLFTINDLSSLAGLSVAVYVIVAFLKEPLKSLAKGDWVVRPFTVLVALSIISWAKCVQGDVTLESIGLTIINAFLVALVTGAAHDYIVAPTKTKAQTYPDNQSYSNPLIPKTYVDTSKHLVAKNLDDD